MKSRQYIPEDAVRRLFLYHRALIDLHRHAGVASSINQHDARVTSSDELSLLTGCSAAQIRKDLTYFGQFGTPGKGYSVADLTKQIKSILGINRDWEVALVGVGNLGRALIGYAGLHAQGFKITRIFDNQPSKIGKSAGRIKIKDIAKIPQELSGSHVKIGILTVPATAAQDITDALVDAGVKTILNFAPIRLNVPAGVKVLDIDMTSHLARLSYYLVQSVGAASNR
ncbi:MAG: redox-sensing transcriptional repressor Rex [Candidatus Brocadiia bacterium]